jgi:hypothetical protein
MLAGFDERTLPYIEFSEIGAVNLNPGRDTVDDNRLTFRMTNNSVYPVRTVRVSCSYDLPYSHRSESDDFYVSRDRIIEPGESIVAVAGKFEGTNLNIDPMANPKCEAVMAAVPFSVWSGIPYRYASKDWRAGYKGRSRTL